MTAALPAGEAERAKTWHIEIVKILLPGVVSRDEGGEVRFLNQGGLVIRRSDGAWYAHAAGRGGLWTVPLIMLLAGYTKDEATLWVAGWLEAHPGTGACGSVDEGADASPLSADAARDILARAVDIQGTPAAAYLESRQLTAPFPSDLMFLADARCGEGGLVAPLYAHDRVVGCQVTYIDPDGRKSLVSPPRRRFMLEKAPGAVFAMPHTGENPNIAVCEGLEDALSVWRYGALRCRILGLAGVGTLRHLRFPKAAKVTVIADGDPPDSPARKSLQTGLDALLLQEVDVHCTVVPPAGLDANRILTESGVDALQAFIASATPAKLSDDGEIIRLSRMSALEYERVRKQAAEDLRIRVGTLDELVTKAREAAAAKSDDDWADIDSARPWADPVDGAELLDDLEKTIGNYVVMTDQQRWAVSLWVIFTHVFDAALNAPKLWIRSAEPRSGKTRLVSVLRHLVRGPLAAEGMTASVMVRLIERSRPTLLLDEIDNWVKEDPELRKVINSGFDPEGCVWINVPTKDGWDPKPFSTWTPQALAGLGGLHPTNADRALRIELDRKPRKHQVARLRRGDIGPLIDLRLKAARWAEDNIDALRDVVPPVPEGLNDRAADAWALCFAIADHASEMWGKRARGAALAVSGDGFLDDESVGIQLLSDIREVWEKHAKPVIASQELVNHLLEREDRPWIELHQGRPITPPRLARLLKPFHISPGTIRIAPGPGGTIKGYKQTQFDKVFERYLPPGPYSPPDSAATTSQPQENCQETADFEPSQGGACDGTKSSRNPSVSAACGGVTAKKGGKSGAAGKEPPGPTPNGPLPNGRDTTARKRYRRRGDFTNIVREFATENPGLTPEQIGKKFKVSRSRIERILGARS